ncbi:MAG: OmpA family protein [Acidobacteriota bacterium]
MKHAIRTRTPSQDRWLVSYADFSTLLFALFATMYAISSVDAEKLTKVAKGVQQAFDEPSREHPAAARAVARPESESRGNPAPAAISDIRPIIVRELAPELATHRVEVSTDRRGVILSIPEAGLFAVGSDEMSLSAQALMARVASTVARVANPIRVEGHTDDLPIHTDRFRSNWDLSTSRATRVVSLLVERGGIAPDRLSAAGYAEFHPRAGNGSADDRARNRRVDLVILNDATLIAEEPAAAFH